jgi:glycosyltransferase involved in cell wall biosynthesis
MGVFFSIVVPTYNRSDLITETIKSIQNQTYENWECIVVDDGSTDNTKEVVRQIANGDNRVKYVFQKNAERSAARNNGIKNSCGKYICFLDSDDRFLPRNLEVLKQYIESKNSPIALIVSQAMIVSSSSSRKTSEETPNQNTVEYLFTHPITPSRVCVHGEILKNIRFDEDIVIVEDMILWMKIASAYPVIILEHVAVNYIVHEDNSVNRGSPGILKAYSGVLLATKRYPEMFARISKATYHSWVSRIQTNVAIYYILNNRRWRAVFWLAKAIMQKPAHEHLYYRLNLIFKLLMGQNVQL